MLNRDKLESCDLEFSDKLTPFSYEEVNIKFPITQSGYPATDMEKILSGDLSSYEAMQLERTNGVSLIYGLDDSEAFDLAPLRRGTQDEVDIQELRKYHTKKLKNKEDNYKLERELSQKQKEEHEN